jgi:hypothetical protein
MRPNNRFERIAGWVPQSRRWPSSPWGQWQSAHIGREALISARGYFSFQRGLACAVFIRALTLRLQRNQDSTVTFYPIDFIGGERGTRTLDLGIMRPKHQRNTRVFKP